MSARQGMLWSDVEDRQLLEQFDLGASLEDLCLLHERTRGSIASRLTDFHRIIYLPHSGKLYKINQEPWA